MSKIVYGEKIGELGEYHCLNSLAEATTKSCFPKYFIKLISISSRNSYFAAILSIHLQQSFSLYPLFVLSNKHAYFFDCKSQKFFFANQKSFFLSAISIIIHTFLFISSFFFNFFSQNFNFLANILVVEDIKN